MSDHHPCGPSSLFRRSMCQGSLYAESGLPDTDSEASAEGTMLHEQVWSEDYSHLSADNQQLLDMANQALLDIAVKYQVAEWCGERRFELSNPEDGSVLTYGTVDAWGWGELNGKKIVVIADFKFGYKAVNQPSENHQLAAYATAVAQETGANKVVACVIQPRVMGSKFTEHPFKEFREITKHIAWIIRKCNEPKAKRRAGGHCDYCKAFDTCPQTTKMTCEVAEYDPQKITVDNILDFYINLSIVKKKIKSMDAFCKQFLLDNGGSAKGIALKEKNGARYIPALQDSYEQMQDLFSVDEFLAFCSAQISNLESEYARRAKAAGIVQTIKDGKDKFNEIAGVQRKKPTLTINLT